jgi:beta-lactamase regulating signal transducer with metallopeptidase domain
MSVWGITTIWCALQVTLIAGTATVLILLCLRRAAVAGSYLPVAALGAIVLLTALAFCPMPACWHWQQSSSLEDSGPRPQASESAGAIQRSLAPRPGDEDTENTSSSAASVTLARLTELLSTIRGAASAPARENLYWPRFLAALSSMVAGGCLLRLFVGLKAIRDLRRRSTRIEDPRLLEMLQTLQRAMHCPSGIAVRESSALTTAATVGWLRPVVLLPHDWSEWKETERRAVLAHELAHVWRRDYVAGLLAQLALALHFYHPLVHWLVRHLHLQQELAADKLGAQFAGGRCAYLTALARLALRQEGAGPCWPARAFLPAHGTLIRRIQMLRSKEATVSDGWVRARSWLSVTAVVGVALAVSFLRGPAQATPPNEAKPQPDAGLVGKALARQPFDCRYLEGDIIGVIAMRPAAILSYPSMKPHAKAVNFAVQRVFMEAGLSEFGLLGLDVADIEQVVAGVHGLTNPKAPKGQHHAILVGQPMIRVVKPMDWAQMLTSRLAGLDKREYLGHTYYTYQPPHAKFRSTMGFFFPDDRTLVCNSEVSIRRFIERAGAAAVSQPWDRGWHKMEGSLCAFALDFRAPMFSDVDGESPGDGPLDLTLQTLMLGVIRDKAKLTVGFDGTSEEFLVHAFFACAQEQTAAALAKAEAESVHLGKDQLRSVETKSSNSLEKVAARFVANLLDHATIDQHGTDVELHMSTKLLFGDVVRELLAGAGTK